jgi:hypothetical protein
VPRAIAEFVRARTTAPFIETTKMVACSHGALRKCVRGSCGSHVMESMTDDR